MLDNKIICYILYFIPFRAQYIVNILSIPYQYFINRFSTVIVIKLLILLKKRKKFNHIGDVG